MSKQSSSVASNADGTIAGAPSLDKTKRKVLRTRHFKTIPPCPGSYPRGSHISKSSLYLRVPSEFYESHLRTCVRLLVELCLDRSMLMDEQLFVCEEMRVLVSWVSSENAFSWSVKKVSSYAKQLCTTVSLDPRTGRCPELSPVFVESILNRHLQFKTSME